MRKTRNKTKDSENAKREGNEKAKGEKEKGGGEADGEGGEGWREIVDSKFNSEPKRCEAKRAYT